MINVVSLLYFRIAHLERQLTYRYDDFTVCIPVDEPVEEALNAAAKQHHKPERLFQLTAGQ